MQQQQKIKKSIQTKKKKYFKPKKTRPIQSFKSTHRHTFTALLCSAQENSKQRFFDKKLNV